MSESKEGVKKKESWWPNALSRSYTAAYRHFMYVTFSMCVSVEFKEECSFVGRVFCVKLAENALRNRSASNRNKTRQGRRKHHHGQAALFEESLAISQLFFTRDESPNKSTPIMGNSQHYHTLRYKTRESIKIVDLLSYLSLKFKFSNYFEFLLLFPFGSSCEWTVCIQRLYSRNIFFVHTHIFCTRNGLTQEWLGH